MWRLVNRRAQALARDRRDPRRAGTVAMTTSRFPRKGSYVAKNKSNTAQKAVARKNVKTTRVAARGVGTAGREATKTHVAQKMKHTQEEQPAGKKAKTTQDPKHAKSSPTVPVDRRRSEDRRTSDERRKKEQPVAVERRKIERRVKVSRRRQIDPTTCERDYTPEELEFMSALDEYKRTSGRMFPTCSEILEVIEGLGYQKATTTGHNVSSATGA
jgi:hypothetical protein